MYEAYMLNPKTREVLVVGQPNQKRKLEKEGWIQIDENLFLSISGQNKIDYLEAENKRLRAALEKYADNSNWLYDTEYCIYEWQGEADNPASLAQEALKETE